MTSLILMSELKRDLDIVADKLKAAAMRFESSILGAGTHPIPAGARFAAVYISTYGSNHNNYLSTAEIDGIILARWYNKAEDNNHTHACYNVIPIWSGAQNITLKGNNGTKMVGWYF